MPAISGQSHSETYTYVKPTVGTPNPLVTFSSGYDQFYNTAIPDTTTCVLGNCYLKTYGCGYSYND